MPLQIVPDVLPETDLKELTESDVREGLVRSISPAPQKVRVHVVLYLAAQRALGAGVDDKLLRVALVKLGIKDMSQQPEGKGRD